MVYREGRVQYFRKKGLAVGLVFFFFFFGVFGERFLPSHIMFGRSISTQAAILLLSAFLCLVDAHTVIVYPGWRGNNLHSNGTVEQTNGLAAAYGPDDDQSILHPYGMQWEYPC